MSQIVSNIAEYLTIRAQEHPELLAVAVPLTTDKTGNSTYQNLSYGELDALVLTYIKGLDLHGIKPGMRCALMVKPSIEFFALTFALLRMGAVLVCIDPGMGLKNMKACLEQARPSAFIGIAQAHIARFLFSWPKASINLWITRSQAKTRFSIPTQHSIIENAESNNQFVLPHGSQSDNAAILFTSGSTGTPKGVMYQHRQFISQVHMLRQLFGIEIGEKDLCTFPLFALFAPALGMSSIIPDMDFTKPGSVNPLHVITPIQECGITNMFGSPALIKRVAKFQEQKTVTLPSLKRVISAGAPARPDVLASFSQMLQESAQVFTPYGATESLPVSNIGSKDIITKHAKKTDTGHGVCVGQIAEGMKVFIIPISDEPITSWDKNLICSTGTIGEIVVSGPVVTKSYFGNGSATQLAKIHGPHGIMHRMGDLGYFDEAGLLWFCGRKSQRVQTADTVYYTIPCEGIFNKHPLVERSALIPYTYNNVIFAAVCLELKQGANVKNTSFKQELLQLASAHACSEGIEHFFIHPQFPVDIRHNAKINREQLSIWAKTQKALGT